jgi:hypothetical protein
LERSFHPGSPKGKRIVVKGKNGLQAIQVTMAVYEIPAKRSREKRRAIFTAENAESAEEKSEFNLIIKSIFRFGFPPARE